MARGPIGHTCPDIDKCISAIDEVQKAVSGLDDLIGRRGLLEELREANDTLRTWGAEMEDERDEALKEVEHLTDLVAELEEQLEELRTTKPEQADTGEAK